MPMYDHECQNSKCGKIFMQLARPEERNEVECPYCQESSGQRIYIKAPGLTKATYVDGHKRPGWEDLRQENRLEQKIADTNWRSQENKEAKQELAARRKKQTEK